MVVCGRWHVLTASSTYMWIEFMSARDALLAGEPFEDVGLFGAANLPFGDLLPFIVQSKDWQRRGPGKAV